MTVPFTAPAPSPAFSLPATPLVTRAGLWLAGGTAVLMLVAPVFTGQFSWLLLPLLLVYALLLAHIARGARAALFGYLAYDLLLAIPSIVTGNYPVDSASPAPWLDMVFFGLTVLIWGAMLHKDTRLWLQRAKAARLAAPLDEQLALARRERKMALAWILGALALVRLLARHASLTGAGLALVAGPFVLVGLAIAVTQALRLHRLREQARSLG
jgi:hypothetical protein